MYRKFRGICSELPKTLSARLLKQGLGRNHKNPKLGNNFECLRSEKIRAVKQMERDPSAERGWLKVTKVVISLS